MSGFTPELKKLLIAAGCFFVRKGRGDHEVWESPLSKIRFTVDNNINQVPSHRQCRTQASVFAQELLKRF